MKKRRVGTITLAVGLIILGVVLFANNFTELGIQDIYKYWPVLLIGLGLEMIAFMTLFRGNEEVKLKLDGLCVAFIIVAAILATSTGGFNFGPKLSFNPFEGNMMIDGVRYKSELKETFAKDNISKDFDISKLTARNSFGDIKVLPYDQDHIKVEAQIKVKYNDEQAARAYAKDVVRINEGQETRVSTVEYNGINKNKYGKANVDFVIYLPRDVYADINCSFGDIAVQGIGEGLLVANQHGEVSVMDIAGDVKVKNSFGDIEVKNINGKIEAENQHGGIDAENISMDARIETSFGDIQASHIGGSANVRNNYGEIVVKDIQGDAQLKSSFGDIAASNIDGNTTINDNNGEIDATELKGNVQIRNSFGDINYNSPNTANADIYAKTSFGEIETNLPISVTKSANDHTAQGKTGEGKYRIDIMTNNGEIELK